MHICDSMVCVVYGCFACLCSRSACACESLPVLEAARLGRYLHLDFCNGVDTKEIRENKVEKLRLSGMNFDAGNGIYYGMEVVGAIFLAHFLRINTSLTTLDFRRHDVQKDGAKALAQAIIGHAHPRNPP